MFLRSLSSLLLIGTLSVSAIYTQADEKVPRKPERREGMMRRDRGGAMMMMRNPDMMIARMVRKELKAYQNDPTDANYAALEKATREASKKVTAQIKEMLEKQLAELEKNQNQNTENFLKKVKSGEIKMPQRPPREKRERGERGERPRRGKNFRQSPEGAAAEK